MSVALGALCCGVAGWALVESDAGAVRENGLRVALLDVSESVTRVRSDWTTWVVESLANEARAAQEAGEDFAVVAFAEEVVRWHGPADPAEYRFDRQWLAGAPERRDSTDLAAALLAVERIAQGSGRAPLVRLLGDGAYTGTEPTALLARLHVELVPLPAPDRPDPWLRSVEAASELEPGAPLVVRVAWDAGGLAADVPLGLLVRGLASGERRFALKASGDGVQRLELGPMEARHLELALLLERAGDPIPENNRASVRVRSRGALEVLVACPAEQQAVVRALADAWSASPGLGVRVAVAETLEVLDPATDVLVTLDLDPRALRIEALAPFLERGGGWLAAGGGALLAGLDARDERGAARYLPCEPDDDGGERDVLLVVDASGSMDGEGFDAVRNAAVRLAQRLRARDRLSLHFFTDRLGEAHSLGNGAAEPDSQGERARALLGARRPSGPTDLPTVLEQLVEQREARGGRARIVLLTDGRDQRALPSVRGRLAVSIERLDEAGAQLAVLASGPQPDLELLSVFERPEFGCSLAPLGADLAASLERATDEGRWKERARSVRSASGPAGASVRDLRAALAEAPGVARTLVLRARDGDELLLEDDDGAPMAAVRLAGSGTCAVLATLPGPDGSPLWQAEASSWLPLVRALGRGRSSAPEAPSAHWEADGTLRLGPFARAFAADLSARVVGVGENDELQLAPARSLAFPAGTVWDCDSPALRRLGARVEVRSGGEVIGVLPVPFRCPEEYLRPARSVRPSGAALTARSGFGPRAGWVGAVALVLGVAFLSSGALLGGRSGRASEP